MTVINQAPGGKKWAAHYFCGACGKHVRSKDNDWMGLPSCCPVCGFMPPYREYAVVRGYWSQKFSRGDFMPHPEDVKKYSLILARKSISEDLCKLRKR